MNVSSGADGLDSNGNINITGGLTTIVKAASNGGEGGVDYEGSFYAADGTLENPYGITMDSGMGGQMGGFPGGKQGQQGAPQESQQSGQSETQTQDAPQNMNIFQRMISAVKGFFERIFSRNSAE